MATPLTLFVIAGVLGALAGYPLSRARWSRTAPRLTVALWHALCFGVVSSVVLGGVALALPVLPSVMTGGLSELLARCAMALRAEVAAPGSLILGTAGLLLAIATIGRLAVIGASITRETRNVRRAQRERLAFAGRSVRSNHGEDLVLLLDERPAAYCLPGGSARGTIVISSGTVDLLDDDQLSLVLAHERAHLHQRHHLATRLAAVMFSAFGWVPLFRHASREVPLLLEMAADDQAMRTAGHRPVSPYGAEANSRHRLAHALLALASARTVSPAGALAAAGNSAVARVRRLSEPHKALGAGGTAMLACSIVVAFAGPLLLVSAPALCAAAMEICPIAFT